MHSRSLSKQEQIPYSPTADVGHPSRQRLLAFVRIVWSLLVPSLLVLSGFFFPRYLTLMHTLCTTSACSDFQPRPYTLQALHSLGLSLDGYVWLSGTLLAISALIWWAVAAIIAWKNFSHWFALSVSLLAALQATMDTRPPDFISPLPYTWQLALMLFIGLVESIYPLLGVFFPDGKLAPRWTRWILIIWFGIGFPAVLLADFPSLSLDWQNLAGVIFSYCWYGCMAAVLVAQVYRYRHLYGPVERQQTKWVLFCGTLVVIQQTVQYSLQWIFPALSEPGSLFNLFYYVSIRTFLCLLSLSILMAMLRYRLWDIDVIINRTLVYGTLTAILIVIYASLVLTIGLLSPHVVGITNNIAIVLSTLVVAVLFQPLRARVQQGIDHRFYRSKYDAAQVISAFSATLHNRADLAELKEHLVDVVDKTMHPTSVSVWMEFRQVRRNVEREPKGHN
jgi:hypothetical protein